MWARRSLRFIPYCFNSLWYRLSSFLWRFSAGQTGGHYGYSLTLFEEHTSQHDVALFNHKGFLQADLSKYASGSAKFYITVSHASSGASNNPPARPDNLY